MKKIVWDLVHVIRGEEIVAQIFQDESKFLILCRDRNTDHIFSGLTKEFKHREAAEAQARIITGVKKI